MPINKPKLTEAQIEENKEKRAELREKLKKRVLNRDVPKLGRKIYIIKNADKDTGWMESWGDAPKNIGKIPHPFRLLALGGVGRGKTNNLKNLFLHHQGGNRKFKELYICCCDVNSKEWLNLEPTGIMDELPSLELFDPTKKTMLIIDDFEFEKSNKETMRRLSTLFRFVSSHRNVSIMCGYQSWFDCPTIARKCASCYLIYKPNGKSELSSIANRVGMESEDMHYIFKNICSGIYDSLFVDKTIGSPAELRKNIFEKIEISEESDESDSE
jgi:hypothetical protein